MKIAFVLPTLKVSGGVRVAYEFANRLQGRGHEVAIACIDGETTQNWFPLTVPIISRSALVKQAPSTDIVIATGWQTVPISFSLAAKARVYYVQMFETLFHRDFRSQHDSYATYQWPFDGFVTVSNWLQRMLLEEFRQESVIVPNVVNRDMFYPEPRFPKGDRVRVLIEGSHAHYKGVKDAFAAVAGLPVEAWSLSQQGPLGPVDRSFILPPQDAVRQIYSSCDILLKTSWYEGRPLSHIEAMACGCALVSTHMYAVDDLIHEHNALIVPPRDIAAIKAALIRLIEDPSLRKRLIEGGLETVRKQDWEKSTDQMEQVLSDVLGKATNRSTYSMPSVSPSVHVALFSESDKEQAQSSLEALRSSTPHGKLSVSVIDDGIHPDATEYFTNQGLCVLTRNSDQNYAQLWQQVVRRAGNGPIVLLSTSVRIDRSDWIQRALGLLKADAQVGVLGVKLAHLDWTIASAGGVIGPASKWALDRHIGTYGLADRLYFYNELQDVEWVDSRCVVIAPKVAQDLLEVVGVPPLGEGIVEYCLEVKRRGWRVVYFPQIVAWLEAQEPVLKNLAFEDLLELDAKKRLMIVRERGLAHLLYIFSHDLNKYGLGWAFKRFVRWLRWFLFSRA